MPISRRWMVLPILAFTLLTSGVARPDSIWAADGSSCLRLNCYPVTGGTSQRSFNVPGESCMVGVTSGGGCLWVLGVLGSRSILKIDPATGSTVSVMTIDTEYFGASIAYGDGSLWVLLGDMKIARVDPSSGQVIAYVTLPFTSAPPRIACGGGFLWAVEHASQIHKVDPSSGAVLQTLAPAGDGWISSLTYGDGFLWAADLMGSGKVSKIDPATGAVISTANLGDGRYIAALAYEGGGAPVPVTVSAAKSAQPGTQVALSSAIVTAQLSDCLYIESADRSSGIRIIGAPQVGVGNKVDVAGTVEESSGEKAVRATTCTVTGAGPIRPLGISAGRIAANGTAGLCSVGLFVRTWGEVTARGTGCFYVDDGSHPLDGTGSEGLRVLCEGITPPALGRHVRVTGISTLFPYADSWLPALRLRTSGDVKLLD